MIVFKGSERPTPSDHVTVNTTSHKTKAGRERAEGWIKGISLPHCVCLSPMLQIQSVGEISPSIILTERQVNLRETFKTDLGSSPSLPTPSLMHVSF